MDKQQRLADLKTRIRRLERNQQHHAGSVRFGIATLDRALLDEGLPLGCIHEVYGDDGDTAPAVGFVSAIMALMGSAPIVWIAANDALYMPGLADFGITYSDLLCVSVRTAKDGLWAMEEALRWPGLRAVVAELDRFDLTATRRLQLAAEASGVTGFIVSRKDQALTSGATRWRIAAAPSTGAAGSVALHVALARCKGGRTAESLLGWQEGAFSELAMPRESLAL